MSAAAAALVSNRQVLLSRAQKSGSLWRPAGAAKF
jgi:hypothetical protein